MEKTLFTTLDLHALFQMQTVATTTLVKAEKDGLIPIAGRLKRGRVSVRQWRLDQLPQIGLKFGFLKRPKTTRVICVYTPKGGCLKSSLAYSLARMTSLNGLRTLIIGLDLQQTITDLALSPVALVESLEDAVLSEGISDVILHQTPLAKVIKETALPTLDIIPETAGLGMLEMQIRHMKRREYLLSEKIVRPLLKKYDVIFFDNSPNWNSLIENALTAANVIISPIGCDLGSYQALDSNQAMIANFRDEMKLHWDSQILVPTLLEKNKLSSQIYGSYLNKYSSLVTHTAIRRAVGGQEALAVSQSPGEYNHKSDLARDYFDLAKEVWTRVLKDDVGNGK